MKPKRPRISSRRTYYLVLWWMSQTPYAAIFENQVAAEAAANVRNAIRRPDARGMAGPGRADPRALAREAETLALSPPPPAASGPKRPHRDRSGLYQFG